VEKQLLVIAELERVCVIVGGDATTTSPRRECDQAVPEVARRLGASRVDAAG